MGGALAGRGSLLRPSAAGCQGEYEGAVSPSAASVSARPRQSTPPLPSRRSAAGPYPTAYDTPAGRSLRHQSGIVDHHKLRPPTGILAGHGRAQQALVKHPEVPRRAFVHASSRVNGSVATTATRSAGLVYALKSTSTSASRKVALPEWRLANDEGQLGPAAGEELPCHRHSKKLHVPSAPSCPPRSATHCHRSSGRSSG